MTETNPKAIVETYLATFERHDADGCTSAFTSDAKISWLGGTYQGPEAIKQWHEDRFAANLKIIRRDDMQVQGNTVTADMVVTSDRLKTWRLSELGGRATLTLRDGKVEHAKFGLRFSNPLQR